MAKWGEGDPRWIVEERPDATNVNNWHWTEKNASDWSKQKFKELFVGLKFDFDFLDDDDQNQKRSSSYRCKVIEITKSDGDASANNRKAKLIFFFEWELELKFEVFDKSLSKKDNEEENPDGSDDKICGRIEIPNLSDEHSSDEVDVHVKMDANDDRSYKIKEILRKNFVAEIRRRLGLYMKQLKEEYSKDLILPTKKSATNVSSTGDAPINERVTDAKNGKPTTKCCSATTNKESAKSSAQEIKKKDVVTSNAEIVMKTLTLTDTFHCSGQDLYNAFTLPEMIQAFTRSPCKLDYQSATGADSTDSNSSHQSPNYYHFVLFNGHIEGKFVDMDPGQLKMSFDWRSKDWQPKSHFSRVDLMIKPNSDSTDLHLTQIGVPENQYSSTEEGWRRYYFEAIKQTFGFGAKLF